jgi:hypothetical protein
MSGAVPLLPPTCLHNVNRKNFTFTFTFTLAQTPLSFIGSHITSWVHSAKHMGRFN